MPDPTRGASSPPCGGGRKTSPCNSFHALLSSTISSSEDASSSDASSLTFSRSPLVAPFFCPARGIRIRNLASSSTPSPRPLTSPCIVRLQMTITMAPKMPEIMSEFRMASQWVKELSVESLKYISHRFSQLISCSSRK